MENLIIYIYNSAPIFFVAIGLFIFTRYDRNPMIDVKRLYIIILICLTLTVISIINQCYDDVHNEFSIIIYKYGSLENYTQQTGVVLPDYHKSRMILTSIKFILGPIIIVYLWILIMKKDNLTKIWPLYIPITLNALFYITNYWHKLGFYFMEDLSIVKGKLYLFSLFVSIFYAGVIIFCAIKRYNRQKYNELIFLVFLFAVYISARLLEEKFYDMGGQPIINLSIMICLVFYFLFLYSKDKDEYIEEKENELKLSQIKPHFIFNTLSSIIDLCEEDSDAQKALITFSKYLRFNIDTISQSKIVPFNTELNQINIYLELERISYGKRLNYEFDIKTDDFLLPVLTIQPLVENSVKYGLKNKKNVDVKIKTWEDNNNYFVSVEDNGGGFNLAEASEKSENGRKHIGITNVRYRLEVVSNATLTYNSTEGVGTTALVTIPKGEKK